jgi:hypothetical protein
MYTHGQVPFNKRWHMKTINGVYDVNVPLNGDGIHKQIIDVDDVNEEAGMKINYFTCCLLCWM